MASIGSFKRSSTSFMPLVFFIPFGPVVTDKTGISLRTRVLMSRVFENWSRLRATLPTDEVGTRVKEAVQTIAREAIRREGKAAALAARLRVALGRSYNYRTVSGWARGDSMPPADALLAAAALTEVSLDEALFAESIAERMQRMEARLDRLDPSGMQLANRVERLEGIQRKTAKRLS